MSLIPIKLLCNRRPKSSSGSGSGSSSSGTTTNSAALPDWFYFNTEENSVHCKYPLVGDSEVSAFGYGSSSDSGGGGGDIDPSVLENYVTKDYLSQQGYLSSTDMSSYVTRQELSSYVTEQELNSTLASYVTNTALNNTLANYAKKSDLTTYVKKTDLDNTLTSYAKAADLTDLAETVDQLADSVNDLLWINDHLSLGISDGITYLYCKIPIVSAGDIEAFS